MSKKRSQDSGGSGKQHLPGGAAWNERPPLDALQLGPELPDTPTSGAGLFATDPAEECWIDVGEIRGTPPE